MMTPQIASIRITRTIRLVEDGMDELLAKAGELLTELARARVATVDSAGSGHRPLARVAAVQQHLIAARSDLMHAHGDLTKLAETMDIPYECPEDNGLLDDGRKSVAA